MKIFIFCSVLLFSTTLFLFQNCSERGFSLTDDAQFRSDCEADPNISTDCYNRVEETVNKELFDLNNPLVANPTDLLFVLDNSCSMEVIANSVRDGFNSVVGSQFPPNTKMGVTYMSPAKVNDDDTLDFTQTYPGIAVDTQAQILNSPGYMALVSQGSLDAYRAALPTLLDKTVAFNYNISIAEFVALYPGIDYNDPKNGITKRTDNVTLTLKFNPAYPMTDVKRNTNPNAVDARKKLYESKLTKPGCSSDWFNPSDVDGSGAACLAAAIQLTPVCTGVEAGIVTLEHLLKKATAEGRKLFRDNAKINLVLVSDTHEAGYEDAATSTDLYFGTPGARKTRPSLGDLQAAIYENNPLVSSFKVHGIVPLPEVGNPLLDGLNVSGPLPVDAAHSQVGDETLNGFAYLPFIRSTGGLAVHAVSSNWSTVAQSIVSETKYAGNVLVTTKQKIKRVLSISVNDVVYDPSQVVISSDAKSFSIRLNQASLTKIKIKVVYEVKI